MVGELLCDVERGIEGFRKIAKEVLHLSPRDMRFVCVVFNLKKGN